MTIPQVKTHLPELVQFITDLAAQSRDGTIDNWKSFKTAVLQFFTPDMMNKTEVIVPGWKEMASYADQLTLIHVTGVLTALPLLSEYKQATPDQQQLMLWTVLFHDVAKVVYPKKHDYIHAFRGGAVAGKALANVGFATTSDFARLVDGWYDLTYNAVAFRADLQETIQDNSKLPEIVGGLNRMYGADNPAIQVVKSVLLHLSIKTAPNYPILAPLTESEEQRYIDPVTFPIFKVMMLVDTDGWALFEPAEREYYRHHTLEAFDRLATQLGV